MNFLLIVLVGVFLVLFSVGSVSGATYYVSPDGSNTAPYDTWTKASNLPSTIFSAFALNPGDIIELDGGLLGKTYSDSTSGVIIPGSNDDGCIIQGSTESGHNGQVTIDGTVNTNHAFYITVNIPNVTVRNLKLKAGSGKYGASVYADGTSFEDCIIDGSASAQRLFLASGVINVNGTRLRLIDSTSPNYGIYLTSGATFALSYSTITGGTSATTNNYVFTLGDSHFISKNNIYSDLPVGVFIASSGTIISNNDLIFGTHRFISPANSLLFLKNSAGSITVNNPLYLSGG